MMMMKSVHITEPYSWPLPVLAGCLGQHSPFYNQSSPPPAVLMGRVSFPKSCSLLLAPGWAVGPPGYQAETEGEGASLVE